jgi:hypothetical protein
MLRINDAADPEIHRAACMISKRFAAMLSGILRDEEKGEAEREGYIIAREVMEELVTFKNGGK